MDNRLRQKRKEIVERLKKSNDPADLKLLQELEKAWEEKAKTYKKEGRKSNEEKLKELLAQAEERKKKEEEKKQLEMLKLAESLDRKDVELALKETGGWLSKTAAVLGISTDALRKIIKQDKYLKSVLYEVREATLDAVEDALFRKIVERGDTLAAIFWLKCQGQHRGWIDKPQNGTSSRPIYIKIIPAGLNPKGGRPRKEFEEMKIFPKEDRILKELEGKSEYIEGEVV